jgi:hypothetical protein
MVLPLNAREQRLVIPVATLGKKIPWEHDWITCAKITGTNCWLEQILNPFLRNTLKYEILNK